jgi:PadR family transcriptional regulator, regulatory protein PadR
MDDRDLYAGLIRLHILHHAAHEPIFGLGIIEELARHGYKLTVTSKGRRALEHGKVKVRELFGELFEDE